MTGKNVKYFDYDETDDTDGPVLLEYRKNNIIVKSMMTWYLFGIPLYREMIMIGLIRFERDGFGKYQYMFTPKPYSRLKLKRGHLNKIQHAIKRFNDGKEV